MRAVPALAFVAAAALVGASLWYWREQTAARLPEGLARANGRIEVERVDIASKLPGRVAEIRVKEGDFVAEGRGHRRASTRPSCCAQLAAAKAAVQRAVASIGRAEADIAIREAEHNLAEIEMRRAIELEQRAAGTTAEVERRTAQHLVAAAQILGARAARADAQGAQKPSPRRRSRRSRRCSKTPSCARRSPGRVEYKLVQPGEVVAAGGRLVTILDLTDVFMTIFLPTSEAGRVALGSEARIVLDAAAELRVPGDGVVRGGGGAVHAQDGRDRQRAREADVSRQARGRSEAARDLSRLRQGRPHRQCLRAGAPNAAWPDYLAPRLPNVAPLTSARGRGERRQRIAIGGVTALSEVSLAIPRGTRDRPRRAGWRRQVDAARADRRRAAAAIGNASARSAATWRSVRIATGVSSRIAYMPQGLGPQSLSDACRCFENIDFFGRLFGQAQAERRARIERLLRATGLDPFPDRPAGKLSGGMKQKLSLCCSLIHDPDLLILDEPTTGIDPLSRRQFWRLIDEIKAERPGMTVLVSTAYMEEAERFDRLVAIDAGRVLAHGPTAEILARDGASTLEDAYIALQRRGEAEAGTSSRPRPAGDGTAGHRGRKASRAASAISPPSTTSASASGAARSSAFSARTAAARRRR